MAADITFNDVTNATTTLDGTGYFDKLMHVFTLHIEAQFSANRLTGTEYATVYLGGMQSALQAATQFTLEEQLREAQVDKAIEDAKIATAEALLMKAKADKEYVIMLATIDKDLGYSYTLDVNQDVVRASLVDSADGKLDSDIDLVKANVKLTNRKVL